MDQYLKFYINGQWVDPQSSHTHELINPATEQAIARISMGSQEDVALAVQAARQAFTQFSRSTVQERLELLQRILTLYEQRQDELAQAVSQEMGAPLWLAQAAQVPTGAAHLKETLNVLKHFEFQQIRGSTAWEYEPIGVVGMITPWNWPLNQILCKLAPALAAGCCAILKPSEQAPLSALLLTEILHEAGVPAGVFNLINGDGPQVGQALSAHPDIDMISFTGSTGAGVAVAQQAAPSVKRVAQELGGKSANIVLPDVDLAKVIKHSAISCFRNSGQSCNAPTRLLIPRQLQEQAIALIRPVATEIEEASSQAENKKRLGPVVNQRQFDKIQHLIQTGIDEGATLVAGGTGKPEGIQAGYFVRPTVFADVSNNMTIAREEIFGPVLCLIPYDTLEQAIDIANDTEYGLSGYVYGQDLEQARSVARALRTGMVHINGAGPDISAPFGGYKRSGNGREWGEHGFKEYLEIKAIMGYQAP